VCLTRPKKYGAATIFPEVQSSKGSTFIVQFEVKFQDTLTCGGGYIKLFDSNGTTASEFNSDTPYIIMFGPDTCGDTNKVHFILRHQNPKSGAWEEKHFKSPPSVPSDALTHLYGLIIKPDNTFDLQIDGASVAQGNLLESMQPPVNPPKEIDDPTDSKPGDWVDEAKIDDPTASKPDDWDEDAPSQITDPSAKIPAGWNEDAPLKIADPTAKMPDDWDVEEDGEWEPPLVDNPACKVGCGKWIPPMIENPKYKGKWYAPRIDNPKYQGEWKARQIENPDYFFDAAPSKLPKIDGIGIDIWTMSKGILFDNVVVATDLQHAQTFASQSFLLRSEIEKLQQPKPPTRSFMDNVQDVTGRIGEMIQELMVNKELQKSAIPVAITAVVLMLSTVWCCCCRSRAVPSGLTAAKESEGKPAQKEDKNEDKEADEKTEEQKGGHARKDKPQAESSTDEK